MIATSTPTIPNDIPYWKVCYSDSSGTTAFTHTEPRPTGGGTTDPIAYYPIIYSEITRIAEIQTLEFTLSHKVKNPFEQDIFKSIIARHGIIKRDQFNMGAISQINRGAK